MSYKHMCLTTSVYGMNEGLLENVVYLVTNMATRRRNSELHICLRPTRQATVSCYIGTHHTTPLHQQEYTHST